MKLFTLMFFFLGTVIDHGAWSRGTSRVKAEGRSLSLADHKGKVSVLVEVVLFSLIISRLLMMGVTYQNTSIKTAQVMPDYSDVIYPVVAMTEGISPLLPLGNEFHLSVKHNIHMALMAGWMKVTVCQYWELDGYSQFVIILSIFFFLATLHVLRVSFVGRLAFLMLCLLTTAFYSSALDIFQDVSIMLFLSLGVLLWATAARFLTEKPERQKTVLATFALTGFVLSLAVLMRPPTGVILVMVGLHIFWLAGFKKGLKPLGMTIMASLTALALSVAYYYHLTGQVIISPYSWFGHSQSMMHSLNFLGDAMYGRDGVMLSSQYLLWQDLSGKTAYFTAAGQISQGVLAVGLILTLVGKLFRNDKKRSLANSFGGFCAVFFAAIFIFEFQHQMHASRFWIPILPFLYIAGIVGWEALLGQQTLSTPRRMTYVTALLVFAGVSITLETPVKSIEERLSEDFNNVNAERQERVFRLHRLHADKLKSMDCPIFVDQIGTTPLRIMCDLLDYSHPISLIEYIGGEMSWEPHIGQIEWFRDPRFNPSHRSFPQAIQLVSNREVWLERPNHDVLIDSDLYDRTKFISQGLMDRILESNGKFALYFPGKPNPDIEKLMIWINAHYHVEDCSIMPEQKLYVVRPNAPFVLPSSPLMIAQLASQE